ncbi:MAG: LPS export ABC transporter periplasmic protein LptC [Pseudomonadota bacterium]|nr:LPS export ABC transporter periplasmic protein LptC [Pseudomonadota bacterium]
MPETPGAASWAKPGSSHDRLVRLLKFGLPTLGLILLLLLAIAPFGKKSEVSFLLDKNKADKAQERMRVETARYTGSDDKGQPFEINADHAVQQSSAVRVVDINGMKAKVGLDQGPVSIAAEHGRYDLDRQSVAVPGAVKVRDEKGYHIDTSNVKVDLKRKQLNSGGPVSGTMKLGAFSANHLSADLGNRTVTLNGGARLKIVQGAVKGR